ncbi:MAG: TonB-dependent receptor [Bacteroidales bacterium]|nr:TonB-dependent receptor [Bacteroidales bacterium]
MKNLVLTTVLFISGLALIAETPINHSQTIRGKVMDAVTGFPLPGAHVILQGSDPLIAVSTDLNGQFTLASVPVGRQNLEISYVGYLKRVYNNVLLNSGKEVFLEVFLEEAVVNLSEITVVSTVRKEEAINEMALVSARTFSVEETERYAGSLGDPARMVANFAGVMTQNDSRNDIIIRGNSPTGVLWRLEGIEIPNPNHFGAMGTTGGPVSMVNNNLLGNSDFLTGAFPAEFGNATAGVFDLNLRSGNANVREFTGQVGFNGFELGAEGPAFRFENGQNASYLANFRYSTLEVMDKLGFNMGTGAAIPQYKDFTFLADVPGTKSGRFKVFGLWGKSFIDLGRNLVDTTENQYNLRGTATDFGSDLAVIGTSHTYFFNENTRIKSTLSWQQTSSSAVVDSIGSEVFIPVYRGNQTEQKWSLSSQLRRKVSANANYVIGVIIDRYSVDYIDSVLHIDYGHFVTNTDATGDLLLYRAYGQWQQKFGTQITAYAGSHLQYVGFNDEFAFEPRLGMRWQFAPRSSLNAGFGVHSMMQPREIYFYQGYDPNTDSYSRTNEDLKMTRSNQFVLGYQYLLNSHFRIKAETYYQQLYNVPVKESFPEFSQINTGDMFGVPKQDSLLNKGKGRNYGLELTVERFLNKGWYFLLTASLFDSKYTGYDGVWRNTAFNGNYVFNLLGGYEFKVGKNATLTVDLKTVLAGGKRFIPVDFEESLAKGKQIHDWSRSYENRFDDYFRTDLRFGIRINRSKFSHEWGIDLQNISGYQSIFMESYDARKNEVYQIYQQGFVPMFLYRIQF